MKIILGLIDYGCWVQEKSVDFLIPIRDKMKQIILVERAKDEGYETINDVVGYIDPKEPDAIQALLGHREIATTMIYTHVIECDDITSPLDRSQEQRKLACA